MCGQGLVRWRHSSCERCSTAQLPCYIRQSADDLQDIINTGGLIDLFPQFGEPRTLTLLGLQVGEHPSGVLEILRPHRSASASYDRPPSPSQVESSCSTWIVWANGFLARPWSATSV